MPYSTSVYPAKVAIFEALKALAWTGTAPSVAWGAPTQPSDIGLDIVYLGPTTVPENTFTALGGGRSDEEYRISVWIDVRMWGDDEQATEAQAWTHYDDIATYLSDNPTLGGTVNRVTGITFGQVNPVDSPESWRSQIVLEVAVIGLVFS